MQPLVLLPSLLLESTCHLHCGHRQKELSLVSLLFCATSSHMIVCEWDKCGLPGHVGKQAHIWHFPFLIVEHSLYLASKLMKLSILQIKARALHGWKPTQWQSSTHSVVNNVLFILCLNSLVLKQRTQKTWCSPIIIFKHLEHGTICSLASSKR